MLLCLVALVVLWLSRQFCEFNECALSTYFVNSDPRFHFPWQRFTPSCLCSFSYAQGRYTLVNLLALRPWIQGKLSASDRTLCLRIWFVRRPAFDCLWADWIISGYHKGSLSFRGFTLTHLFRFCGCYFHNKFKNNITTLSPTCTWYAWYQDCVLRVWLSAFLFFSLWVNTTSLIFL